LTPQETRVAALARQGMSDRDIGRKLFISQKTVETHLMRVYRKMDVGNRRELMLRHA
jgi:DNA-binding CsgD family transcriptional regulator